MAESGGKMPTVDDFIRPKEWVSEFVSDLGKVIRRWGEDRYLPIRQRVDDDRAEHWNLGRGRLWEYEN
jgi:hypothetical protein